MYNGFVTFLAADLAELPFSVQPAHVALLRQLDHLDLSVEKPGGGYATRPAVEMFVVGAGSYRTRESMDDVLRKLRRGI